MPRLKTWLTEKCNINVPFVQGGLMHLGKAELVSAVARAGALGFITAFTFESPQALQNEIRKCREMCGDKPFGVNFTLLPSISPPDYPAFARVAVEEGITIFETAGNPQPIIDILHSVKDYVHIHKVISIRHAIKAQKYGVSAVTIDGFECAGHPGEDDIGSLVLMARAKQELTVPFLASGGYADGRGAAAAFSLGAVGVSMGTRWICTKEAPLHESIKHTIVSAKETDTAVLLKPLNNSVRCYNNSVAKEVLSHQNRPGFEFPEVAHLMSGKRGVRVFTEGDPDLGIWSLGQAAGLVHDIPSCQELTRRLEKETIEALSEANRLIVDEPSL